MKIQVVEWSLEESLKLQRLYRVYKREWSIINKELNKEFTNNRTSAQCRYHYFKINKEWKQKQIELLIFKRLQGTEWNEIVQLFPGRKEKEIQAKYNALINTETFDRIYQLVNKEYKLENQIKTIEQKLAVEEIHSFKFKLWQTPNLPDLHKMITKGRKIILNDFDI